MKIGILTDIHEDVEKLKTCLARFQTENVDQIVQIGDVFEMGHELDETCQLLSEANVVGVWGNHDYGLCVEGCEEINSKYSEEANAFMQSLTPRLEVAGCHFTHVEPWLNPEELVDLWHFEKPPSEQEHRDRIFNAVPNRLMFMGHYHQWLAVTPDGIADWEGDRPLDLSAGRHFIVVGAVCNGCYAILDTDTWELTPFNEGGSRRRKSSLGSRLS